MVVYASLTRIGTILLRRFYVDQVEHGEVHEFDHMSNDEPRTFIVQEAEALSIIGVRH